MAAGKPFKTDPDLMGGNDARPAPNSPMAPHPVQGAKPGTQQIPWPAAKPLEDGSKKPFKVK